MAPSTKEREFTADGPDQRWVADVTYIRTAEGWLYLAVVMDLFSKAIVGWSMSERLTRDIVLRALLMALWRRKPDTGLLHHSDRGSQLGFNRSSQQGVIVAKFPVPRLANANHRWSPPDLLGDYPSSQALRMQERDFLTLGEGETSSG